MRAAVRIQCRERVRRRRVRSIDGPLHRKEEESGAPSEEEREGSRHERSAIGIRGVAPRGTSRRDDAKWRGIFSKYVHGIRSNATNEIPFQLDDLVDGLFSSLTGTRFHSCYDVARLDLEMRGRAAETGESVCGVVGLGMGMELSVCIGVVLTLSGFAVGRFWSRIFVRILHYRK